MGGAASTTARGSGAMAVAGITAATPLDARLWAFIDDLVPEVRSMPLQVRLLDGCRLALCGRVDAHLASLLNVAVHRFRRHQAAEAGQDVEVSRRELVVQVPQVRLGDVTTEAERRCLRQHTKNDAYADPNSMVSAPEWNQDFVTASDRRYKDHIKPRYIVDDERTLDAVASFIADHCDQGNGIVVHTGAGISAAAGIATYREGTSKSVAMSAAMPTYAHYALVAMVKVGAVDYVCSQNVDGLHRRSGMSADRLSELHGNSYIETCSCCTPPMEFVRPYDAYSAPCVNPKFWAEEVKGPDGRVRIEANCELTANERASGIPHITGRACPRGGGPLRDSVIHFRESLPRHALHEGERRSQAAPLNLVVGSSLLVTPAADLPFAGKGPVAIVARTCTGRDLQTLRRGGVLLHCEADDAIERVVQRLPALRFPNKPEILEQMHTRVKTRDRAVLRADSDVPYDGGADGGVVPDELIRAPAPPAQREMRAEAALTSLRLQLRQTHRTLPNDDLPHAWSLSLEGVGTDAEALNAVACATFKLHETFSPSEYVMDKPPFIVGPFRGWGTFQVRVEVQLRGAPGKIRTSFPLRFDRDTTTVELQAAEVC